MPIKSEFTHLPTTPDQQHTIAYLIEQVRWHHQQIGNALFVERSNGYHIIKALTSEVASLREELWTMREADRAKSRKDGLTQGQMFGPEENLFDRKLGESQSH